MFHFSFPSSGSSLCLLSPLALMCCKQAKKGPAVWSYCWCQQEVLIAFAAEQKLDEGSGGALQTLWLQPRFSPTIPAPHSHCSAHPALPPPRQLRPGTEGKKKEREKKKVCKVLQATATANCPPVSLCCRTVKRSSGNKHKISAGKSSTNVHGQVF